MKRIYLVHRWGGNSRSDWYLSLANKIKNHAEIIIFDMPNTENPTIKEWVTYIDKNIDKLDNNTYFIGHSIGCQTIMRYLESKDITSIGGLLFVAPWTKLVGLEEEEKGIAKEWIDNSIDFSKLKKFTTNIVCLFSKNDYYVPLDQIDYLGWELDAKTKLFESVGHFTEADNIKTADFIYNEVIKLLCKEDSYNE
jgi:predicted alpha/beta hydrolase family esterase